MVSRVGSGIAAQVSAGGGKVKGDDIPRDAASVALNG